MNLEITIDTREQTPWHFPEEIASVTVGTLPTGDYALRGDGGFAIERKTLDDFVGTIASGWERFCREIDRMEGWPAKVIIVEADFEHVCWRNKYIRGEEVYTTMACDEEESGELVPPGHNHFKIEPQFVLKRIAELTMRGVTVLFAGDVSGAVALACAIFKQRQIEIGVKL